MAKYKPQPTSKFIKDVRLLIKRGYDISLLMNVVEMLLNGEALPAQYHDHPLKGNKLGYRDCHIESDWVLIYKINDNLITLILSETGTHSALKI